ncbi:MAG: hypothetical protein ACOYOK_08125 [Pseudobdellovibrionaceae bacterium]
MRSLLYLLLPLFLFSAAHAECVVNESNSKNIDKQVVLQLKSIAIDQAQIWGDTILEGDYETSGKLHLDKIEAIYEGEKIIAYRIQYSEKAWDVSRCNYNPADPNTLQACLQGRIVEVTYVDAAFDSFTVQPGLEARFVSQEEFQLYNTN